MRRLHRVRASLLDGFTVAHELYVKQWAEWLDSLPTFDDVSAGERDLQRTSMAVLACHESKDFPGGIVASLSIPWGFAKGDNDLGGYHLVWPRDQVECAGAFAAMSFGDDVRRVLTYLQTTQESDGHWVQNSWLDGSVYWSGIQLGETAMPLLLLDLASRHGALLPPDTERFWPMVRRAAEYLHVQGPLTGEDRWEQEGGYSPFTLATVIAGFLVAGDWAPHIGENRIADYLRQTADIWNDHLEKWIYVTDSPAAKQFGVEGHYLRLGKGRLNERHNPPVPRGIVEAHRRDQSAIHRRFLVSPDPLALVRFGLRAADDPRIVNTVPRDRRSAQGRYPKRTGMASFSGRSLWRACGRLAV